MVKDNASDSAWSRASLMGSDAGAAIALATDAANAAHTTNAIPSHLTNRKAIDSVELEGAAAATSVPKMDLREVLDVCQLGHADDWVLIPGNRPATAMMSGVFDPGFEDARTRPLAGHSIAVYEPNPAVSMVWPVPEDDAETEPRLGRPEGFRFEWDEERKRFKNVRSGYVVIALSGSPVWQTLIWYLDWGSGIGGYVANFSPIFDKELPPEQPEAVTGWEASAWEIRLAGLVNSFSHTARDWAVQDPTDEVVTRRLDAHPLDLARKD